MTIEQFKPNLFLIWDFIRKNLTHFGNEKEGV